MTDRERTIKWLECCGGYNDELEHVGCTSECPYWESENCCNCSKPFQDALALLKEQESVKPIRLENWWKCPSCGGNIVANMKYCPGCGRSVMWDA